MGLLINITGDIRALEGEAAADLASVEAEIKADVAALVAKFSPFVDHAQLILPSGSHNTADLRALAKAPDPSEPKPDEITSTETQSAGGSAPDA